MDGWVGDTSSDGGMGSYVHTDIDIERYRCEPQVFR